MCRSRTCLRGRRMSLRVHDAARASVKLAMALVVRTLAEKHASVKGLRPARSPKERAVTDLYRAGVEIRQIQRLQGLQHDLSANPQDPLNPRVRGSPARNCRPSLYSPGGNGSRGSMCSRLRPIASGAFDVHLVRVGRQLGGRLNSLGAQRVLRGGLGDEEGAVARVHAVWYAEASEHASLRCRSLPAGQFDELVGIQQY